jgi:hypothetical protein
MSETQSLSDLANFAGQSALTAEAPKDRQHRANALAAGFKNRPQPRGVADLLGVVLTLSARTRRLALPKVGIDLDVFTPDGDRAVRLFLPR